MIKNQQKELVESDILILGGGCSGWSLIAAFIELNLQEEYRITIVEDGSQFPNKTWSFWEEDIISSVCQTDMYWNKLKFNLNKNFSVSATSSHIYQSVSASSFIGKIREVADRYRNIEIITDKIIDCNYSSNDAEGQIQNYKASLIFQNFFAKQEELHKLKQSLSYPLLQHFKGIVVKSKRLNLDSEEAIFMDFEVNQNHGFAFMYVLPYSSDSALFEYTLFSERQLTQDQYEHEIAHYLADKHHLTHQDYIILEEESGVIPMNDIIPTVRFGSKWFKMGTIAGMTKASTGYTFARIQKASKGVAKLIQLNGIHASEIIKQELEKHVSKKRYRIYDIILLDLLKYHPNEVIKAFNVLFKNLGVRKMLRFLSENQGLIADFHVLNTVQKWPFIKAIWRARKVLLKHLQS